MSGRFIRWSLALIYVVCTASVASASAIDWQVAAGCPDERAAQKLAERLGVPLQVGDAGEIRVRITRQAQRRFAAEISMPEAGVRRIEGDDCRKLAEASVLVIAIAHDPLSVAGSWPHAAEAARTDAQMPGGPTTYLAVEAGADLGSLPQPTGGGGLLVGLTLPRGLRVEAAGYAWLPRNTLKGPTPTASAEMGLYVGALRGCLERAWGRVMVGPCLGVELGAAWGRGLDVERPRRVAGLWSAGWLGVLVRPREDARFLPMARV